MALSCRSPIRRPALVARYRNTSRSLVRFRSQDECSVLLCSELVLVSARPHRGQTSLQMLSITSLSSPMQRYSPGRDVDINALLALSSLSMLVCHSKHVFWALLRAFSLCDKTAGRRPSLRIETWVGICSVAIARLTSPQVI